MRSNAVDNSALPWKLLGVHSAGMDMGTRDLRLDETLGLNCAWYADILLTLTAADAPVEEVQQGPIDEPEPEAASAPKAAPAD
jgi:hypothetical protein